MIMNLDWWQLGCECKSLMRRNLSPTLCNLSPVSAHRLYYPLDYRPSPFTSQLCYCKSIGKEASAQTKRGSASERMQPLSRAPIIKGVLQWGFKWPTQHNTLEEVCTWWNGSLARLVRIFVINAWWPAKITASDVLLIGTRCWLSYSFTSTIWSVLHVLQRSRRSCHSWGHNTRHQW